MISVVVPVHNEEGSLSACLQSLQVAAMHPDLDGEAVVIVVVLDHCTDESAVIAERHGVICLVLQARNVGQARAHGANHVLEAGARWLAFTDADTQVAPDWLVTQLSLNADVVCGSIGVLDWQEHPEEIRTRFEAHYVDADGHRHIHGANLGIRREAYIAVGGFSPLAASEDVALVNALTAGGWRIAWSAAPRVLTSARRLARAEGGFASFLLGLYDVATRGGCEDRQTGPADPAEEPVVA